MATSSVFVDRHMLAIAAVGVASFGTALAVRCERVSQVQDGGRIRTTSIEVVDAKGRVRIRLGCEKTDEGYPSVQILDEHSVARVVVKQAPNGQIIVSDSTGHLLGGLSECAGGASLALSTTSVSADPSVYISARLADGHSTGTLSLSSDGQEYFQQCDPAIYSTRKPSSLPQEPK